MDYNSQRSSLVYREYGRNIQSLIEFAVNIEEEDKRNEAAQEIIRLMGQMSPHLKNVEDFRHKLWDHIFQISDFKLKVDSPYPIPEDMEAIAINTERIPYPTENKSYKHYGKNVKTMIEKAIGFEDEEKKAEFIMLIANFMKMAYQNWTGEIVNDDTILADLKVLSQGKLSVPEGVHLNHIPRPQQSTNATAHRKHKTGARSNTNRGGKPNHNRSSNSRSGGQNRQSNSNSNYKKRTNYKK